MYPDKTIYYPSLNLTTNSEAEVNTKTSSVGSSPTTVWRNVDSPNFYGWVFCHSFLEFSPYSSL